MILTIMPLPVHPSIAVDGGSMQSEADLTYKPGDVIKASANARRRGEEGAPALQKSGCLVKTIRARLEGKEGCLCDGKCVDTYEVWLRVRLPFKNADSLKRLEGKKSRVS